MLRKEFPKRAIHLDFHTMPSPYDLSDEFDPAEFAQTLHKAKVDYITVFARCNLGFAYYPTKVGIPHPHLKTDMLGGMVEECHKLGIQVAAYINAGLDHEHAYLHRDWCKVDEQGRVVKIAEMGNFNRMMCYNTSYRDHILGMIDEVLDKYPVDGVFLDCITSHPCYGAECLEKMKTLGMDIMNPKQVVEYAVIANKDFCNEVTKIVHGKVGDNIYIYYNGMPYSVQPTHLELEVLPTGGWGYDYLPFAIRYARSLGKPYFTMTGRFHRSWGDFGGLRHVPSMEFDLYYSLANGGTCSVGDHLHPRGKLDGAVYDRIGEIFSKVEKLEPWTYNSKPQADILILDPTLKGMPHEWFSDFETSSWGHLDPLRGACRMLSELKQQYDVTDGKTDFSSYKMLVLPDSSALDDELLARVKKFVQDGGAAICSGFGGFDKECTQFALAPEAVVYKGKEPFDPIFFTPEPEVAEGIPDMPNAVYVQAAAVEAGKGAKVLANVIKPYNNVAEWDWNHEYYYTPPEKSVGRPAALQFGNVAYISFPMFAGYYINAVPAHKTLLRNILTGLLPAPLAKAEGMPSFGHVVTAKSEAGDRLVHLISYVPELRGTSAQVIEEPIWVKNVKISLRKDNSTVERVYLAPAGEEIAFEVRGDYVEVDIAEFAGHQLLVFETKKEV